jgi:hypothetical protein
MSYDRNPKFGADAAFSEGARRVADLLWENTGGELSAIPSSYLETLRHEFADGRVSMLELIDRVDLGPEATYDDYCEVVDALLSVDAEQWPEPSSVESVSAERLKYELEPSADFSELDTEDFAEGDMGKKMESFLRKVIGTVYMDGVGKITDNNGRAPSEENNYLLSEDGKEFSGMFFDKQKPREKHYPFTISEKSDGQWSIRY